jgi:hypothetical protein
MGYRVNSSGTAPTLGRKYLARREQAELAFWLSEMDDELAFCLGENDDAEFEGLSAAVRSVPISSHSTG